MRSQEQLNLNKGLFDAAVGCDFDEVERLLRLGADPLGIMDENNSEELLLTELFDEMDCNEELEEALPDFLRLFYAYGMDIGTRKLLSADGDYLNPLWALALCQTEAGLRVLHTMLENGLDCYSAETLVDHIFIDMELFDGCEIEDEWDMQRYSCGLKMVMLVASYPHIFDQSAYIQECVSADTNDVQSLSRFRNWNQFGYQIDLSTCTNIPHGLRDATVRIQDLKTGENVWTMVI